MHWSSKDGDSLSVDIPDFRPPNGPDELIRGVASVPGSRLLRVQVTMGDAPTRAYSIFHEIS